MKAAPLVSPRVVLSILTLWFSVSFLTIGLAAQEGPGEIPITGKVYAMGNRVDGNTVVVFQRSEDGALNVMQEVSTGGRGIGPGQLPAPFPPLPSGDSTTTQDSLVMTEDGRFLLAANGGSDEISVLAVTDAGLELVDKVYSGGKVPLSIAHHNGLVYVMNIGELSWNIFGEPPVIAGFSLDQDGKLHPIPNSTRVTGSPDANPGDIAFSPDGQWLIITDKFAASLIHVLHLDDDATTHEVSTYASSIPAPFAIAFPQQGIVAIVEANAGVLNGRRTGVTNGSSLSTYRLTDHGTLDPIDIGVRTEQTVACWVRFTPNHKFGYVTNTGSGTISSYQISNEGELSLLASAAGDAGSPFSEPTDLDITPDGKFLYVVSSMGGEKQFVLPIPPNAGEIRGFRIAEDGSLTPIGTVSGFPISIAGMVAR